MYNIEGNLRIDFLLSWLIDSLFMVIAQSIFVNTKWPLLLKLNCGALPLYMP